MNASLVVISGPIMKETVFPIGSTELVVGREVGVDVQIPSKSVSRRHCCVRPAGGGYLLVNLGSRNGTFVNGSPIGERLLEHGDLIRVGDAYFRFVAAESEEQQAEDEVAFDESSVNTSLTIALSREDAAYLQAKTAQASPSTDRRTRDLQTLVTFAAKIGMLQELNELHAQVLESIAQSLPAERGAILEWESSPETLASQAVWDKREKLSGKKRALPVSRTILRRVAGDSTALLVNDVSTDSALRQAGSIVSAKACSILCAPLTWTGKTFGAIYLDTQNPAMRFTEDDLQLAMGIAGITSAALVNLQRVEKLRSASKRLQAALDAEHNMVGESAGARQVALLISRVASSDSTVLLYGESGTGKELAALAIHRASVRRDGPIVAINCAAIPAELLESELFGHERGAFTGALVQKKGLIENADGGTLFLDEIGELALSLQAKLLRVLQEREFTRVGGTRPVHADVRFLAATNRDLAAASKAGTFRQDLFYRLNVISIALPPLRERRDDILLLARFFAAKIGAKCKRPVIGISPEAESFLVRYDWPGNIRELENAMEHAVVMGSSEFLLPEDLPEYIFEAVPAPAIAASPQPSPMSTIPSLQASSSSATYQTAVVELKKQLILDAVRKAGGNYTEAAKHLRVSPNYLHRLIKNLNIKSLIESGSH